MKTVIRLIQISALMMASTLAWSGEAVLVLSCEQADDASEDDVIAVVADWLAEAKQVKGGENLNAFAMFPVAVTMGSYDLMVVITAPNFEEWGRFIDAYEGNEESEVDNKFADTVICPDSALWESTNPE
jgi:hypothetical protein